MLLRAAFAILDNLGYLPFSQSGGALLFQLLSKLYEHTSVIIAITITINVSFAKWSSLFGDTKTITVSLGRLRNHCHIVEKGQRIVPLA